MRLGSNMICFSLDHFNYFRYRRNVRAYSRACFRSVQLNRFENVRTRVGGSVLEFYAYTFRKVVIFIRFQRGGNDTPINYLFSGPFRSSCVAGLVVPFDTDGVEVWHVDLPTGVRVIIDRVLLHVGPGTVTVASPAGKEGTGGTVDTPLPYEGTSVQSAFSFFALGCFSVRSALPEYPVW